MRCIDGDALIAQMEADAEQMEEPIAKMFTYAAINDVKHAPTIELERKTGEWIVDPYKGTLTCSTCKEEFSCFPSIGWKPLWDFCPYCGSRNESAKLTEGGGKE